jgi:hypothetical protein
MIYAEHIRRDIQPRPDLYNYIQVRDAFVLYPYERKLLIAGLANRLEDVPPVPNHIWYRVQYRKKPTGQILWKTAHAQVINAR